MKRVLASFLALFGGAAAAQPEATVQTIDPKALRYTMPTVAADSIEFVMPTKDTFEGAPQFHEDEWAQLEFFPASRLGEVQRSLSEYKPFEESNRGKYGWERIYSRSVPRSVFIAGPNAAARIAAHLEATPGNSPILTTTSRPLGQVKGGFSIRLSPDTILYGLENNTGILILGALQEAGGDHAILTNVFSKLNLTEHLIMVDWRGQFILTSTQTNGQIEIWRP